jgi:hypothetical protein
MGGWYIVESIKGRANVDLDRSVEKIFRRLAESRPGPDFDMMGGTNGTIVHGRDALHSLETQHHNLSGHATFRPN